MLYALCNTHICIRQAVDQHRPPSTNQPTPAHNQQRHAMQTHDFFSRMIALNQVGPNVATRSSAGADLVYVCGACNEGHDYLSSAEDCCRPEVLERYSCASCEDTHIDEKDALNCCGSTGHQPRQCPVCMQVAESYEIAADCCLHTHPTMTADGRRRVAESVMNGTTWADAVSENAFH